MASKAATGPWKARGDDRKRHQRGRARKRPGGGRRRHYAGGVMVGDAGRRRLAEAMKMADSRTAWRATGGIAGARPRRRGRGRRHGNNVKVVEAVGAREEGGQSWRRVVEPAARASYMRVR